MVCGEVEEMEVVEEVGEEVEEETEEEVGEEVEVETEEEVEEEVEIGEVDRLYIISNQHAERRGQTYINTVI